VTLQSAFRVAFASAFLASTTAGAHHSYVEFDDDSTVEIEGTLIAAAWQNPHAMLKVRATDGSDRSWDIETSPLNYFRRLDAPLDIFAVGSQVKVAGWPSKRAATRMYGTNILSADGRELVLWRAPPRWGTTAFGLQRATPDSADTPRVEKTIFRSWGSFYARPGVPDDPDASPGAIRRVPLPLTDAAREAAASFDAVQYNLTLGCTPKGMPIIMNVPTPMEFVNQGESILLRIEEFDTVRTIHMSGGGDPATQPKTLLGYSVGRWEGDTLVVDTTRISEGYLSAGVPMGPSARFVERFTPSADGQRLHYTVLITDPYALTQVVEQKRSWIASTEEVLPFNCTLANGAPP
jgi:Family of unknown function (DUF6152)